MDISQLTSLITKAAKTVEDNEKLALPVIAAKARREAAHHPNDVPLINASQILTKMASNQTFISKDELRNILNKFTATHSKLTDVFSDEIGKQAQHQPHLFSRSANDSCSLEMDYNKFSDPVLANALSAAMEKDPVEKLYSNDTAKKAQRAVSAQLLSVGIDADKIETFAGRNEFIICQACHNTPKGIANVLIPVEIKEGKALLPTLFLSRDGFKDIEKSAYIEHALSVAGKSFRVDGSKLLSVLEQVKNGSDNSLPNEVEMAAIKIASEKGIASTYINTNDILYTELDNIKQDVQLPKLASTEESTFAETLSKPEGIARFVHSDKIVEAGRSLLIRKFAEMGFSGIQTKVVEVEQNKIFYAVAVGTSAGFKVPVEISGTMVMPPKVVFADNAVLPFNKVAISEVVKSNNGGNKRALAAASPCYDLKPTELLDIVKESVAEGNYIRAEEAINVLGEIDPVAQKVAIAHMMINIYEPGQNPGEEKESMQKLASKKIYDTPQFMTNKIFFPEGA